MRLLERVSDWYDRHPVLGALVIFAVVAGWPFVYVAVTAIFH